MSRDLRRSEVGLGFPGAARQPRSVDDRSKAAPGWGPRGQRVFSSTLQPTLLRGVILLWLHSCSSSPRQR